MKMITSKIAYIFVAVVLITGCRYTFTDESEIEVQLLKITVYGITSEEARIIINGKFGKESYWGHGLAESTSEGWRSVRWFPDSAKRNSTGPYYFVYKIGSHLSPYVVLPTHVFASWFFDENDRLVEVDVNKEIDGI